MNAAERERVAAQWLRDCSDHRGEQILSLAELLKKWGASCANEALEMVDPYYASRNLHQKYLKLDNEAAGIDGCADALDERITELESLERAAGEGK